LEEGAALGKLPEYCMCVGSWCMQRITSISAALRMLNTASDAQEATERRSRCSAPGTVRWTHLAALMHRSSASSSLTSMEKAFPMSRLMQERRSCTSILCWFESPLGFRHPCSGNTEEITFCMESTNVHFSMHNLQAFLHKPSSCDFPTVALARNQNSERSNIKATLSVPFCERRLLQGSWDAPQRFRPGSKAGQKLDRRSWTVRS
jgi:hypothetical protein